MKLGETIRALRLEHKLTQEQLADRLGVSYQSVSRWENHITYPDVELLPALARCFSVSVDTLFGDNDAEKAKELGRAVGGIAEMGETDRDALIDLIRVCRREPNRDDLFERICDALRYSPLHKDADVLTELRKTAHLVFETCTDAALRSRALGRYACLEEEAHVGALLDRYASEQPTARDYLLKERYLFRDEYEHFDTARQRYLHKQIVNLLDGDLELWRDTTKPKDANGMLVLSTTKLAVLHAFCQEVPTQTHPVTCGKQADVFAEQRLYLGLQAACAYTAVGEIDKAYAMLEDAVALTEAVMALPDGATVRSDAFSLGTLVLTVKEETAKMLGRSKVLWYTTERGEQERGEAISPKHYAEWLTADYSCWGWLAPIRGEIRFAALIERLKTML